MLRSLLSNRGILVGLFFFGVIVGGSLIYSWHIHRTTDAELAHTQRTVPHLENKNETPTVPVTHPTEFEPLGETSFETHSPQGGPAEGVSEVVDKAIDVEAPEEINLSENEIEEGVTNDFPEVPDGFPMTPVWEEFSNYQKGDMQDHETLYRVLIKLWNQGDHGFVNGVIDHNNGKVYPLYPDVIYVKWKESVIGSPDDPVTIRIPGSMLGTHDRHFSMEDRYFGLEKSYPEIEFVDKHTAGYDPETFLTDDEK